jgi:hypothetical protein
MDYLHFNHGMPMKIGRNDPCHCGSGKKYKKCCLLKDEEAKRAAPAKPIEPVAPAPRAAKPLDAPKPPPDPRIAAWNARWEAFAACDYEDQIALFQHTLDEPELMDGEMAFEMLSKLFHATVEHNERDRFEALVDSLRERQPKVYDQEAHHCLDWLISNALVAKRYGRVQALTNEMAALAGKEIDLWNRVESQLAYHGQLFVLVEAMRIAWPKVRRSRAIVPWGIDEFAHRAMDYELLDYTEHTLAPDASDPALLARLNVYSKALIPERLAAYLAHLTGQAQRQWTMHDFEFVPPRRRSRQDWDEEDEEDVEDTAAGQSTGEQNSYDLTIEFLGYLHRVEGVPYTKGELGRRELARFIFERHAGDLEYQESMLESMQSDLARQHGRKLPPTPKYRRYEHQLVPDRERLERFLGSLLQILNQLYYQAAAVFELLPAWLRFLESRHLIDATLRVRTLSDLASLTEPLCKLFGNFADDPTLHQALLSWHEDAAKEPLSSSRIVRSGDM